MLAAWAVACGGGGAGSGAGARSAADRGASPKDPFGDEGRRARDGAGGGGAAPPSGHGTDDGAAARMPDVERRVHELVNVERAKIGATPLAWDAKLGKIARVHSTDMAARRYFGHVSPDGRGFEDRYAAAGYRCAVARPDGWLVAGGENVFAGNVASGFVIDADGRRPEHLWTTEELARLIAGGWMASPPHKKNLLERYWKREGIGVEASREGDVLVTQNFC